MREIENLITELRVANRETNRLAQQADANARRLCAALSAQGLAEARLAALDAYDRVEFERGDKACASNYIGDGKGFAEFAADGESVSPTDIYEFADALRARQLGCTVAELPERRATVETPAAAEPQKEQ